MTDQESGTSRMDRIAEKQPPVSVVNVVDLPQKAATRRCALRSQTAGRNERLRDWGHGLSVK
jgi:hypothetical protein